MSQIFLKRTALFLVICFLNLTAPWPSFAGEVEEVIDKLTPQHKEEIKNLPPEKKEEIKSLFGDEAPAKPAKRPLAERTESKGREDSERREEPKRGEAPVKIDKPVKELSKIELGFLERVGGRVEAPLKQFGYDVFEKAVGPKFALVPSIPIGPDYRINPRDKLLVTIWGNVNETFDLIVDDRGTVTIPKVGVVQLAGYSLAGARDILYQRLANVFIVDFNIDLTIREVGPIKIYLLGEFVAAGTYTVLANTSLYDAIFTGGGPARNGSLRKIELVRNGRKLKTVDLYDFVRTGKKKGDVLLRSGDVIRVPAIGKVVAINGNVRRPGIYELKSKTELSDFIGLAGGITPTTYLQRIQIERRQKNKIVTAIDVNYADYAKTKRIKPAYLGNLDYISVFSIEPTVRNVVYLAGNVTRPGRYELEPGLRLADLFIKAQGLAPEAYMERAEIYRLEPPDMHPRIITINLNMLKLGDPQHNPFLQEFDRIRVFSKNEIDGKPGVYISGELNDGDGYYPLSDGMRVSDLIFQAGGVKESAYLESAELVRTETDGQIYFYKLSLNKILKDRNKSHDMLLKKNDYVFVRRIPKYGVNETVVIKGNVKYPGKYAIYRGERLSSMLTRSGGYTEDAFLEGATFIRGSIKEKQLKDIRRLEGELEARRSRDLSQIPAGLSSEDVKYMEEQINRSYEFAKEKMKLQIPGRVILDLYRLSPGSSEDLVLQDGDYLEIPDKVNAVTVLGEVHFPGSILYERGKSISFYVNACGGGTDRAETGKLLLLHASGRVEKVGRLSAIIPGDTILVPSKPVVFSRYQKPFDWGEFWDVSLKATTAITQITTSLVTVFLLYKSLNQ